MYCNQCGNANPENSSFCNTCGAPFVQQPTVNKAPISKNMKIIFGCIAGFLALVLVLAIVLSVDSHGFDTAQEAALAFVKGSRGNDPDLALEAMYPDVIDEDVERTLNRMARNMKKRNNHSFKVEEIESAKYMRDDIEEFYSDNDADVEVKDVKYIEVSYKSKGDSARTWVGVYVAKIDGTWYAAYAD